MNKSLFFFLVFFSHMHVWGQTVMGKVMDEKSQPLPYTNVIVKSQPNNVIVAFGQTDNNGEYAINIGVGTWIIEYSLLSYDKVELTVTIEENKVISKDVVMYASSFMLDEVEITPQLPIQIKNDTIVFNVSSFLRGNEKVVEDVIKNLPGVAVNENGVISAYGKEIEKVLLEGDDLLGKGYMLLTKGLSVIAVNQIELLNEYSENSLTKDLISSDKVALNLKLDESAKQQWIGMTNATMGIKDKYECHLNLLRAAKKSKCYMTGHINNIGDRIIDDLSRMINQRNRQLLLVELENNTPDLDFKRYNFNREKVANYSNVWHPANNARIEISNSVSTDLRNHLYEKQQVFGIDSVSYAYSLNRDVVSNPLKYVGSVKTDIHLHDSSKIATTTHLLLEKENFVGMSTLEKQGYNEKLGNRQLLIVQGFNYTNRLSDNKLLSGNIIYRYQYSPQSYTVNNYNMMTDILHQYTLSKLNNFEANVGYINSLNKLNRIQLTTGLQYQDNIFNYNSEHRMKISNVTGNLSLIYTYLFGNIKLEGGGSVEFKKVRMGNIRKSYVYPLPFINLDWNMTFKHRLKMSWAFSKQIPDWTECIPYTIQTSINTRLTGSGQIDLLSDVAGTMEYQYGNWEDVFLANLKLSYIKNNLFYGIEQNFDSNSVDIRYMPLKRRYMFSVSGNIDYYINPISSNIKLFGKLMKISSKYRIKDLGLFPYRYSSFRMGISLKSVFQKKFNFDLGGSYCYMYNELSRFKCDKINTFGNLYFNSRKFRVELNASLSHFKNNSQTGFSHCLFVDSKLSYDLKSNVCSIFVYGNNLTNTKKYSEDIYNDFSHTHITYALQPRNVLVGIEYRF